MSCKLQTMLLIFFRGNDVVDYGVEMLFAVALFYLADKDLKQTWPRESIWNNICAYTVNMLAPYQFDSLYATSIVNQ